MNHKLFFLAVVFVHQIFAGCHSVYRDEPKLYKISVVYTLPYMHTKDSAAIVKDSSILYLFGPYRMYGVAHREDGNINGTPIYDSLKMTWFIFKEQSEYGYYSESINDRSWVTMKVDSFLAKRTNAQFADSLITHIQKVNDSILDKNRYVKTIRLSNPYIEHIKLWFDKRLLTVDHSLSKRLDSLGSSRLSKIEILIAKGYSLSKDTGEEFRRISLTQKKLEVGNGDTVLMEGIRKVKAFKKNLKPGEMPN